MGNLSELESPCLTAWIAAWLNQALLLHLRVGQSGQKKSLYQKRMAQAQRVLVISPPSIITRLRYR
jgi:hypothetical protein